MHTHTHTHTCMHTLMYIYTLYSVFTVILMYMYQDQQKLSQPGQAKVSYVANNAKRATVKLHTNSDYREGLISYYLLPATIITTTLIQRDCHLEVDTKK